MSPLLLLAAPAPENREASPIALVVVLILLVALIFLIRSMNRHLRKIPATFTEPEPPVAAPVEHESGSRPESDR